MTLKSANPLVPSPVIWNKRPASVFTESSSDAVTTYKMSKFGPPKVIDVTALAGIEMSKSTFPSLKNKILVQNYVFSLKALKCSIFETKNNPLTLDRLLKHLIHQK